MKKEKVKIILFLHGLLMVYSMSGICSKKAAAAPFLSPAFCFYYGMIIALLGLYAIGWQQIIKRLPLTTAFANKAVTIVWGIVWGTLFFGESITIGKMAGALFVVVGVVLHSTDSREGV